MPPLLPPLPPRERLLVDCDPCLTTWGLDVDDDLALLFLLGSPEVELVGVTTTFGNSLSALTYRDARALLRLAGRSDIPVCRGAGHSSRDYRETEASRFLVETVEKSPGDITLLTLGPLTNLAAAVSARPGLERKLRRLVIMGGRSRAGLSEFNFRAHPAAAKLVLGLGCPKTHITFDICFGVAVTRSHLDRLEAFPDSVIARFLPKLRRFARWQHHYRRLGGRFPEEVHGGFHPWDAIAAAWIVKPELFGDLVDVFPGVDEKGRTSFGERGANPVSMPRTVNAEGFLELFLERVTVPVVG